MQDDSTNQSSHQTEPKRDANRKRKPFAKFLIESEIKPLVFVGRCMQYFGLGAVLGFLLGAVGVYGYAFLVKSLPLVTFNGSQATPTPTPTPPPERSATRRLHGTIKTNDRPTSEDIEIGVLLTRQGPFQDGNYSIEVPNGERYQMTFWNVGYQRFKLVEVIPDPDGRVQDVIFPSGLSAFEQSRLTNNRANNYASNEKVDPMRAAPPLREDKTSVNRSQLASHSRRKRSPL